MLTYYRLHSTNLEHDEPSRFYVILPCHLIYLLKAKGRPSNRVSNPSLWYVLMKTYLIWILFSLLRRLRVGYEARN
jgi:hypothetical protein